MRVHLSMTSTALEEELCPPLCTRLCEGFAIIMARYEHVSGGVFRSVIILTQLLTTNKQK